MLLTNSPASHEFITLLVAVYYITGYSTNSVITMCDNVINRIGPQVLFITLFVVFYYTNAQLTNIVIINCYWNNSCSYNAYNILMIVFVYPVPKDVYIPQKYNNLIQYAGCAMLVTLLYMYIGQGLYDLNLILSRDVQIRDTVA